MISKEESSHSPPISSIEIKLVVEKATSDCSHYKERYGRCCKNWEKTSLMRGGDMRYACEEFYDDFRACIIETLAEKGIKDVPFFGVSSSGFSVDK